MDLGIAGKVALVTGGSEGIGKETARVLAREGAKVVICARRKDVLERAAAEVSATPVVCDVTDPSQLEALVEKTVALHGRLDMLVNNAGQSAAMAFEAATDEVWQRDLDLKLFAAIRTIRAALPHLAASGQGSIVNLLSIGGKAPHAMSEPSSVTRAAGLALTKALSKELGPKGVRVNAVCIGLVKAAQHERKFDLEKGTVDEHYARMAKDKVPLGRVGETGEAAAVVAFLASPRAGFVNGVALNVDGGASPVS